MTENQNSGQQVSDIGISGQQGNDYEARYKGLVRKVEELTLRNRDLESQLAAKASETEQLRAQLTMKDTEKGAAVGERDRQLQILVQDKTKLESEVGELRSMKLKVEVAKELGATDLLEVMDTIPSLTDRDALKTVMQSLAGFVDKKLQSREKQLLAGITPPLQNGGRVDATPTTEEGWAAFINSKPLGSKEREDARDAYFSFMEAKDNH